MAQARTDPRTVTYTVIRAPRRAAERKTLERLMRMQSEVQRGLRQLAKRRHQHDNKGHQRGGRLWWVRPRTTKLAYAMPGARFTLRVTPQIAPDLASVAKYLQAG
jgi:hypothetical protein